MEGNSLEALLDTVLLGYPKLSSARTLEDLKRLATSAEHLDELVEQEQRRIFKQINSAGDVFLCNHPTLHRVEIRDGMQPVVVRGGKRWMMRLSIDQAPAKASSSKLARLRERLG